MRGVGGQRAGDRRIDEREGHRSQRGAGEGIVEEVTVVVGEDERRRLLRHRGDQNRAAVAEDQILHALGDQVHVGDVALAAEQQRRLVYVFATHHGYRRPRGCRRTRGRWRSPDRRRCP